MINESYICINGKYNQPIKDLMAVPTPGKKISVNGEPLEIRCVLRYVADDKTNLYIDLIQEQEENNAS